ncbi:PREDICTED: mitochondrial dicarboxylate carrier [Dufourea novaeangliae]|uniref:Mitochondrial dicarboxylate carrier n=1 Tax=Dufourea novaeangliae TaxID=178035 RepID=A0A154P682_DUFNO|nr:PREDICTED: mitochondrial dicarboxylate carrier [Dufourea novaeangliae]KZC07333.1 Mitochondrial dicarboxylate carrier [Dufourea novaeangliae]
MADKTKKLSRWYFGGLSSAGAACVTHPLDLIKVHLQTQQEGKISVIRLTTSIIQKHGILALYNGLSASLLRQLTYSTVRFGAYEVGKQTFETPGHPLPFYQKLLLAACSGAVGGIVGTPGDVVNVRMQNDIKLSPELRRNYKHALDGVVHIISQEGVRNLFSGCSTATLRAVLMTIGQLSFYDQIKIMLLQSGYFIDNPLTHVLSSVSAGAIATTLTQPLDVLKTRAMNAKPGEYKDFMELFLYTAKLGPIAFFKGYVPAFIRLAPQTILTFVFLEQLRSNFGFYPASNYSISTQHIKFL